MPMFLFLPSLICKSYTMPLHPATIFFWMRGSFLQSIYSRPLLIFHRVRQSQIRQVLSAGRSTINRVPALADVQSLFTNVKTIDNVKKIEWPHQLIQWNESLLQYDFDLITRNRISAGTDESVFLEKPANIFVEEGASIQYAYLNASAGPDLYWAQSHNHGRLSNSRAFCYR